jgi:SAM-dependent methyltransferase
MVELAREYAGGAEEVRVLVLPDDPLPPADAVVSVGHVLSYLADEAALQRALVAVARAVRPGGLFALDLCDLEWGALRREAPNSAKIDEDWAIVTRFEVPSPDRFVRHITTFLRNDDGSWRRDDERHDNVLVDTATIPARLAGGGLEVTVRPSFGDETLPPGLRVVLGRRPGL